MSDQIIKRFGIIGAAGFVAPRHMEAIQANNGKLVAALDPSDSVGILDSYFNDTQFFSNYERFERFVVLQNENNESLDYLTVCSPNYMHDSHCRLALFNGIDAICEKPLVLNPWNLDVLQNVENKTGKKINNILQLRLHPKIIELKKMVDNSADKIYNIDLSYITSRGPWYAISWKGDVAKSGGLASNIGVHFFDMLIWIFGKVKSQSVHIQNGNVASGFLELEKANVRWFLSVDKKYIPKLDYLVNKSIFRSLNIDGTEIDFTSGFDTLHIESYARIIENSGFNTREVRPVIELIYDIRNAKPDLNKGQHHNLLSQALKT
jgi:UDP-N-acetyl-2-amino-2-deoxyglucuronate dehydrogenase